MFVYPESECSKSGAKGLLIVDTDPTSDRKLLTLIATGEDEYANVDIPVVSIMMEERKYYQCRVLF